MSLLQNLSKSDVSSSHKPKQLVVKVWVPWKSKCFAAICHLGEMSELLLCWPNVSFILIIIVYYQANGNYCISLFSAFIFVSAKTKILVLSEQNTMLFNSPFTVKFQHFNFLVPAGRTKTAKTLRFPQFLVNSAARRWGKCHILQQSGFRGTGRALDSCQVHPASEKEGADTQ